LPGERPKSVDFNASPLYSVCLMKLAAAFSILALGVGSSVSALGQTSSGDHALSLPSPSSYSSSNTGLGTNSKNSSGAAPSATPGEGKTDENDDTLYRGKTSESEVPMLRDEGRLHFKTRPKEKVQEVDSLKNLQSSGSDPKFQGSLLHSSVTSIEDIGEKATEGRVATNDVDSRFKQKQLTFTPEKSEQPQKAESESTPSPTPSATASARAKDSSGPK